MRGLDRCPPGGQSRLGVPGPFHDMEWVPRGGRFSVIRLWCAGVQIRDDSVTGDISADKNEPLRRKIVQFESVHVQVVSRVETASCIQFH